MSLSLLRQALEAEAAHCGVFSRAERRAWGWLYANPQNPDHHDANCARDIRATPAQVPGLIAEVTAFYRGLGLTPRVKVHELSLPADLGDALVAAGFHSHSHAARLMTWNGARPQPPELHPGARIDRATPADLDALVEVHVLAAALSPEGAERVRRQTAYELGHPGVTYYLARMAGEPAACAAVSRLTPLGMLEAVGTVPAWRRRGLAGALMRRIQEEHPPPLFLWVVTEEAERVYRRAGYEVAGEYTEQSFWLPSDPDGGG